VLASCFSSALHLVELGDGDYVPEAIGPLSGLPDIATDLQHDLMASLEFLAVAWDREGRGSQRF
jgi:hypothetical protein